MAAQEIILPPPVQSLTKTRVACTSALSMVQTDLLGKCPGLPPVLPTRDVRIQCANDLVLLVLHSAVSCVEGIRLTSKMSFRALRLSDQFDPIVLRGILLHHLVRAIGRTVADDDPFGWSDRLPH